MTVVLRVVLKEAEEVIRTATVSPFETVPELAQAPPFIRIDGDPSPLTLTGTEVLRPEIVTGLKVTSVLGCAAARAASGAAPGPCPVPPGRRAA